jgi:hypothetical protein
LPSLISEVPGRERIFFVNQELAEIDDMLAGVMHYKKGAGVYLRPSESAAIQASDDKLKLFILVVPKIPK